MVWTGLALLAITAAREAREAVKLGATEREASLRSERTNLFLEAWRTLLSDFAREHPELDARMPLVVEEDLSLDNIRFQVRAHCGELGLCWTGVALAGRASPNWERRQSWIASWPCPICDETLRAEFQTLAELGACLLHSEEPASCLHRAAASAKGILEGLQQAGWPVERVPAKEE